MLKLEANFNYFIYYYEFIHHQFYSLQIMIHYYFIQNLKYSNYFHYDDPNQYLFNYSYLIYYYVVNQKYFAKLFIFLIMVLMNYLYVNHYYLNQKKINSKVVQNYFYDNY